MSCPRRCSPFLTAARHTCPQISFCPAGTDTRTDVRPPTYSANHIRTNDVRTRMPPTPPALRPHQVEAVEAVVDAVVAGERRVTVISACGTGKTLTAAATAYRLAPRGTVLVAVPTLALLTQTIQRWRESGRTGLTLGVSSLAQHRSGLSTQQAVMTNDSDTIAALLDETRGPATVFVTYASLSLIPNASPTPILSGASHASDGAPRRRSHTWQVTHSRSTKWRR
ncbi:DEAD/DEAH box helicase family protein [Streptomyces niveus]